NVSDVPADMARNAAFLQQAFERRGFRTQRIDNPAGRPAVLAERASGAEGLPTVLLYFHYDGQPVVASEWSQADPFEPVVKRRDDTGAWQAVDSAALEAQPLDPELRVFARS